MPAGTILPSRTRISQSSGDSNEGMAGHGSAYDVVPETNRRLDEGYSSGIDTAKQVVSECPAPLNVFAPNATISTLHSLENPWG